ncbi:DUF2165 domain-containing protein [Candidimonas sp. SYP-B2681]|uniref:DUF2165 family protein n=1 Tax=Candidimonas sp. SYP-B2681 TaxID=2497686 RepID=UPI000F86AD71|nr:DUF2165 domain-containing protein [Candidimonas sp. SYP-B2681]RTZ47513.1 DUF2165 domain-containing protein [Candidimonas sp. SYP-B2681]
MFLRVSKTLCVAAIALFVTLVAFGNISDYATNLPFVQHVLLMDSIFPNSTIHYRAITSPVIQHAGYIVIIALETLTALLCWAGVLQLLRHINSPAQKFNRNKKLAVIGLTLGFLTWHVGFISIGGEWFGMWMSETWNGIPSAFRFLATILLVLIYLAQKDDELTD